MPTDFCASSRAPPTLLKKRSSVSLTPASISCAEAALTLGAAGSNASMENSAAQIRLRGIVDCPRMLEECLKLAVRGPPSWQNSRGLARSEGKIPVSLIPRGQRADGIVGPEHWDRRSRPVGAMQLARRDVLDHAEVHLGGERGDI